MSSTLVSLLSLPESERRALVRSLTAGQAEALLNEWRFWARTEQLAPAWDWSTWLILAGRGFGKTRTGAEWVRQQVEAKTASRIALIAETQRDLEDVMVFGESGLWSVFPKGQKPIVTRKPVRITFHTGAVALGYNATEPDQLRGPQFDAAWGDELAKWRYAQETYDQLQFGLRLGARPRQIFTTTPRPIPLIKKLVKDATTAVTRGRTMDNHANLAASFLKQVHDRYAGTRLGRQELEAEILEDTPGALWSRTQIEESRCPLPDLRWVSRIVVAVDPPAVSGQDADACGIVVACLDRDGSMVILDDATVQGLTPEKWASAAVETYHKWRASCLVAEVNQGGEMVKSVINSVDPTVPVKMVRATRGKYVRAEPIAALYEQGKVRHAGTFPALEDQMCVAKGVLVETQRGLIPVENVRISDKVMTRNGFAPLKWCGETGKSSEFIYIQTTRSIIKVTPCHPIYIPQADQFVRAEHVRPSVLLLEGRKWANMGQRLRGVAVGSGSQSLGTTSIRKSGFCIASSMRRMSVLSPKAKMSTTSMVTPQTTRFQTWPRSRAKNTTPNIGALGSIFSKKAIKCGASDAARKPKASGLMGGKSARVVATWRGSGSEESVFNLSVADGHLPEFFANGILTHNCNFTLAGLPGGESPDNLDALVWALTEINGSAGSIWNAL